MAQLQDPDGSPLSWPELHEKVRFYWATHELDGEWKRVLPQPSSGACAHRVHQKCSGFLGRGKEQGCGCGCHS
jgi:hypothetical protein